MRRLGGTRRAPSPGSTGSWHAAGRLDSASAAEAGDGGNDLACVRVGKLRMHRQRADLRADAIGNRARGGRVRRERRLTRHRNRVVDERADSLRVEMRLKRVSIAREDHEQMIDVARIALW